MVNAGGKIVTGEPPAANGWIIGINAPGEKQRLLSIYLSLENNSVATSGDIYQYIEWQGKRYSHIIDPHTGIGLTRRRNVTAIAPDGTTADWLATACSILSWRQSLKLIKKIPGAALLVTEMKHDAIIQKTSVNFKHYLLSDATASQTTH
jgi:thiamine biosynthesis lipoprotein